MLAKGNMAEWAFSNAISIGSGKLARAVLLPTDPMDQTVVPTAVQLAAYHFMLSPAEPDAAVTPSTPALGQTSPILTPEQCFSPKCVFGSMCVTLQLSATCTTPVLRPPAALPPTAGPCLW